jgi:hypothetical protein
MTDSRQCKGGWLALKARLRGQKAKKAMGSNGPSVASASAPLRTVVWFYQQGMEST